MINQEEEEKERKRLLDYKFTIIFQRLSYYISPYIPKSIDDVIQLRRQPALTDQMIVNFVLSDNQRFISLCTYASNKCLQLNYTFNRLIMFNYFLLACAFGLYHFSIIIASITLFCWLILTICDFPSLSEKYAYLYAKYIDLAKELDVVDRLENFDRFLEYYNSNNIFADRIKVEAI